MLEIWEPVFSASEMYAVSNLGRVRSFDRMVVGNGGTTYFKRGKILKPSKDKAGYLYLILTVPGLKRRWHAKVHFLVAAHFLPPSSLPEVNHKDFDKTNNIVCNLEWVTNKENLEHARIGGRSRHKLNIRIAEAIRTMRAKGETCRAIAKIFNISHSTVVAVVNGKRYNP